MSVYQARRLVKASRGQVVACPDCGKAGRGLARCGRAWHGMARPGRARHGAARRGMVRFGEGANGALLLRRARLNDH